MKIAIFGDIHGNTVAFEAVMDDIERHRVDMTVCTGDVINPFPGSRKIWYHLHELKIPLVRGNHEEYVQTYHLDSTHKMRLSPQFAPVQFTARQFEPCIAEQIAETPLNLSLPGPNGDDILICHASPSQTRRSFARDIDEEMAADLARFSEKVIVGGHLHRQWIGEWHDKTLALTGATGLPLMQHPCAHYLLLIYQKGYWHFEHQTVEYDVSTYAHQLAVDGFLAETGPFGWLFFDELLTADHRLVPFLSKFCPQEKPDTIEGWANLAQKYLESLGRWDKIKPFLIKN